MLHRSQLEEGIRVPTKELSYSAELMTFDKGTAYSLGADADRKTAQKASVSVVIPCLNEERFIAAVLQNLANQYDHECYEIIVVDGESTDNTRQVIAEVAASNPELSIRIVDNPARKIPTALNLGIRAAAGTFIVRMDAHCVPSLNYVRRCAQLLKEGRAAIVGMPWNIKPGANSAIARAIALAVAHPFGAGDAKYRLTIATAQFVDTVPFGAFRKSLWEDLGGFNEELEANEDYDFNYRARQKGLLILLDNVAHSDYFARPRVGDLARQYFRYGLWKAQMLKLHPQSVRLRQLVPPAFVSAIVVFALLGLILPRAWWVLGIMALTYLLLAIVFSLQLAVRKSDLKLTAVLPLVFLTIHLSWGSSFLRGLLRSPDRL
jgi:succinoglycan biosynthesis protein ExoA